MGDRNGVAYALPFYVWGIRNVDVRCLTVQYRLMWIKLEMERLRGFEEDHPRDESGRFTFKSGKEVASGENSGIIKDKKNIVKVIKQLPKNPNELLKQGWVEITHEKAAQNSNSRDFVNQDGVKIRFDIAVPGAKGFKSVDHYHVINPQGTSKQDMYLDKNGNATHKNSKPSHIFSEEDEK